jgi:hypothetical protein
MWIILGKYPLRKFYDEPIRKEYRKLQVDSMPFIESFERLDYIQLLKEHLTEHGKPLKPVSRRKGCLTVSEDIICPKCGSFQNPFISTYFGLDSLLLCELWHELQDGCFYHAGYS